jgi:DNA repair protein RadD
VVRNDCFCSGYSRDTRLVILRDYQNGDVDNIKALFDTGVRSVLHVLPTGGGKTVEFAEMARMCHEYGTTAGILVHRDTLLQQASDKLNKVSVPYSIIAPGRTDFGDYIKIASVQTLVRRLDKYKPFDLLIVDEGHHGIAPSYRKIFDAWPDCRILGVTATPALASGRGLGEVYERLNQGPSIRRLMDLGYLSEAVTYGAKHIADLSRVRTTAGDYNASDLAEAMDKNEITGDAVQHYRDICPGKPAVAFCVSIKHAEDVAETFRKAGYTAASIDGRMPLAMIRDRLAGLADGRINVITSCDLISEGFDAPGVVAAILLRPTKSLIVYMQQVGRALRPLYADGFNLDTPESRKAAMANSSKPKAIILDHAGNVWRHGFVDEERQWSLEARRKTKDTPTMNIKICPQCYTYVTVWKKECVCGYKFAQGVAVRTVEERDGTLVQLDPKAVRRIRQMEESQAKTYMELVELGRKRGHSPKWAYTRWLSRGGSPAEAR